MSDSLSLLQSKQDKGIHIDGDTIAAVHHGHLFLLANSENKVYTYNSSSLNTHVLPPPDKSIKAKAQKLCLSPNHSQACVSYEDGSIQLFDLVSFKPGRLISKTRANGVSALSFFGDSVVLYGDNSGDFYVYSMATAIFSFVSKGPTHNFGSAITSIAPPPVFRYVPPSSGKTTGSTHVTAPKFADLVGISTEKAMYIVRTSPQFEIVFEKEVQKPCFAFMPVGSDSLLLAVASETSVDVYSVNDSLQFESAFSIPNSFPSGIITFLSSEMLVLFDSKLNASYVSFHTKTITPITILPACQVISDVNSMYIISNNQLFEYTLSTFYDKMDIFLENDEIENAIDQVKRVIKGDSLAVAGLPLSRAYRAIIAEQALAHHILVQFNSDKKRALETIFPLWVELGFKNSISQDFFPVFASTEYEHEFLRLVVENDPDGTKFIYSNEMLQQLLCSGDNSLAFKLLPPEPLLRHAMMKNDVDLLERIYTEKLDDISHAVHILAIGGYPERSAKLAVDALNNNHRRSRRIVKSILTSGIEVFFNIEQQALMDLVQAIETLVKDTNKPITVECFCDQLLSSMYQKQYPEYLAMYAFNLYKRYSPHLSSKSVAFLVDRLFSDDSPGEELLIPLLKSDIPNKEKLIPLCDAYHYTTGKIQIMVETKRFEAAIMESLSEKSDGYKEFIENLISTYPEAEKALLANASAAVLRDVDLVCSIFKQDPLKVIPYLSSKEVQNYFLHSLAQSNKSIIMNWPLPLYTQYVVFLGHYFPSQLRTIVELRPESSLIDLCIQAYGYDAAAVIELESGDVASATDHISLYFEIECQKLLQNDEYPTDAFDFVKKTLLSLPNGTGGKLVENVFLAIVDTLYEIDQQQNGKQSLREQKIISCLKELCSLPCEVTSKTQLLSLFADACKGLELRPVREALLCAIDDLSYDIGHREALSDMFAFDALDAHVKLVKEATKARAVEDGTRYLRATGLLSLLPCGHLTSSCDAIGGCTLCGDNVENSSSMMASNPQSAGCADIWVNQSEHSHKRPSEQPVSFVKLTGVNTIRSLI